MAEFSSVSEVFDKAYGWQYRVLRASFGTTTGCIVQAMLGKQPRSGPAFGTTCDITSDGKVETVVRRMQHGAIIVQPQREVIGTAIDVRDNLRRLCDHCKLDDKDRLEFFAEFQKWIRKDWRATSEI